MLKLQQTIYKRHVNNFPDTSTKILIRRIEIFLENVQSFHLRLLFLLDNFLPIRPISLSLSLSLSLSISLISLFFFLQVLTSCPALNYRDKTVAILSKLHDMKAMGQRSPFKSYQTNDVFQIYIPQSSNNSISSIFYLICLKKICKQTTPFYTFIYYTL